VFMRLVSCCVFEHRQALIMRELQRMRDAQRQQEALSRDLASVSAQQRRFQDEIRRKQQQVASSLRRLLPYVAQCVRQIQDNTNDMLAYKDIVDKALLVSESCAMW
jgi:hypothetical protein